MPEKDSNRVLLPNWRASPNSTKSTFSPKKPSNPYRVERTWLNGSTVKRPPNLTRRAASRGSVRHERIKNPRFQRLTDRILDVSTLDAKFAESPTIGRSSCRGFKGELPRLRSYPARRANHRTAINPRSCPDNTYHTYRQFENCIQDRGDTIADARRIWFGKLQFNNRWHMSDEREHSPGSTCPCYRLWLL